MNYKEAVASTWRRSDHVASSDTSPLREIVRHATLASSGHNAQCWRFSIEDQRITILPDFSRRTAVVDPDDHHLYVSLGCAAENAVLSAASYGLVSEIRFHSRPQTATGRTPGASITIDFERSTQRSSSPLFDAITERQCTRSEYDGRPVDSGELRKLEAAGTGDGVSVRIVTEHETVERILDCVVEANTLQVGDPKFLSELESWIRFSDAEAIRTGDGLSARVTGNPSIPRRLGTILFRMLTRAKSLNHRYVRQIRSSSGIVVFVSDRDDPAHWVTAGRCYQRFALQATVLDIRNSHLNQPVEVAEMRPQFARALGLGDGRPDLIVRFGRGPLMPRSLRRPLGSVLI